MSNKPVFDLTKHISHKNVLIRRNGRKCAICGKSDNITIDHIVPLSKGGLDEISNKQLLCEYCNQTKNDHIMDNKSIKKNMLALRIEYLQRQSVGFKKHFLGKKKP